MNSKTRTFRKSWLVTRRHTTFQFLVFCVVCAKEKGSAFNQIARKKNMKMDATFEYLWNANFYMWWFVLSFMTVSNLHRNCFTHHYGSHWLHCLLNQFNFYAFTWIDFLCLCVSSDVYIFFWCVSKVLSFTCVFTRSFFFSFFGAHYFALCLS